MGYPEACDICIKQKIYAGVLEGGIKLSTKPFKGNNPKVMLVGLNPTLVKEQVSYVFDLHNKNSPIRRYIIDDILKPTGLRIEDIYATNLVKCTFLQEPRAICKEIMDKDDNETVKDFLFPFFQNCRQHFKAEVYEIKPKILLSFGEIPHQLLVEEFGLDKQKVEKEMKKAFSNIYPVSLLDHDILYGPCIRQKAKVHPYLNSLFPEFVQNLKKAVTSAGIA